MDLTALLAREGIEAGDTDTLGNLVSWARHRAAALVAHIEPGSPLAEALGAALVQAQGNGTPVPRPQSPSAPRPIARTVSRPYLGAAVQAALSGKQEDLELAIETAAADAHTTDSAADSDDFELPVLEDSPAPTPAPAPDPEPELDDNDPSIGGFNRFAFSFRRRAAEKQALEDSRSAMALIREAERQAEASGERKVNVLELPEPPTFEAKRSSRRRAGIDDIEPSGLLVLGIPDEEGIDIPVLRPRPRSAGLDRRPGEGSAPHSAASQPEPREPSRPQLAAQAPASRELSPLLDDEDSFDLGLDNLEADPVAPRLHAETPASGPQAQAPRAESSPHASPRQDSGPHGPPPPRPDSGPSPSATSAKKTQSLRALPPPPPREGKRGNKPPPPPGAAKPTPAPKRGKKPKIVELGQPVSRPNSASFIAAAPSERSGQRPIPADDEVLADPRHSVPDYLRDDDE